MPRKTPARQTPQKHSEIPALTPYLVPVDSLRLDPENAKLHPTRNMDAIKASLKQFGQQRPILVDKDGVVLAGNGTLEAARSMGWTHIAAVRTDLVGIEARAYAIADNRTSELGEWDVSRLAAQLGEIRVQIPDLGLPAVGYNEQELLDMLRAVNPPDDRFEDEVPEPPDAATTRPGDIWVLGNHRLMCGDSSKPESLDRLLDGQPIHLVNTDPPYNVKVEPRSNNAIAAGLSSFTATQRKDASAGDQQSADLHRYPGKAKPTHKKLRAKDRPLANDFVSDDEFDRLLAAWFGNIARVLIPGGGFYIWGGYANCANYPPVLKRHGLYFSQAVIWVKEHPVLTRKDFMGNHEWCFYGWREGAAHRFFGPKNVPDVWSIKKVNPQSMVHLTEKPVELARRAIEYSSKSGENVLDLFGGSGSTLIGAEMTGRRAFLMELDALYCDVIVQRWEKLTGKAATLLSGGKTFAATAKARGIPLRSPAPTKVADNPDDVPDSILG